MYGNCLQRAHDAVTSRNKLGSPSIRYAIAGLVLFAGALVYLARPTDPIAFLWLDRVGLGVVADIVRSARHFVSISISLPAWIRGSASDAAYAFSIGTVFADSRGKSFAMAFVVALGHEVAQGLGLAPGTFDIFDLVVLFASFTLAVFLFRARTVRACDPLDLSPMEPS
jgi:hypothetical protein